MAILPIPNEPSETLITRGNDHMAVTLLEGWTIDDDTYGLWTGVCVFEIDTSKVGLGSEDIPQTGDAHPVTPWSGFMFADKIKRKMLSGYKCQVTVTYVGVYVPPLEEGGATNITKPNFSGTVGTTTEPIENHPNFFKAVTSDMPIAGIGAADPVTDSVPDYSESDYKLNADEKRKYYAGDHGATFVQKTGGKFVGFVDPAHPKYYGKKSYLAPVETFQGVIYTTDSTIVGAFRGATGRTGSTNDFGTHLPKIVPAWLMSDSEEWVSADGDPQLLMTNANFADYSDTVIKITYSLRYNVEGYPLPVYPEYE
jgi:hypothetical protein